MKPCPFKMCDGYGQIERRDEDHRVIGLSNCRCHYQPFIQQQWERTVGAHDRWAKLSKLQPSEKSKLPLPVQEKCIAAMKQDPLGSYLILGQSGTSKTTYAVALYRCALSNDYDNYRNVIRVKAKNLLDLIQKSRFEEGFRAENNAPFTTAERIVQQAAFGRKTRLFLEELEKVKYTEYKTTEVFDIVDALYETGGQLVLTGNMRFEELADTSRFMEGFARRIEETCMHRWDFWKHAGGQQ